MPPILRNVLAVVAGIAAGASVNMALVVLGARLLPPPEGVDVNDVASINAHMPEYSVPQLLVPFVAHAAGTLAGATLAARLAATRRNALAFAIGAVFMAGGVAAVRMIESTPAWFAVLDLGMAYLPMAWLGAWLAGRRPGLRGADGPKA